MSTLPAVYRLNTPHGAEPPGKHTGSISCTSVAFTMSLIASSGFSVGSYTAAAVLLRPAGHTVGVRRTQPTRSHTWLHTGSQ
jgi:hypothetical protein